MGLVVVVRRGLEVVVMVGVESGSELEVVENCRELVEVEKHKQVMGVVVTVTVVASNELEVEVEVAVAVRVVVVYILHMVVGEVGVVLYKEVEMVVVVNE